MQSEHSDERGGHVARDMPHDGAAAQSLRPQRLHEFALQRFADGGAHRAGDDAGWNHRHGQRGQKRVHGEVAHARARARSHAHGGQPARLDRQQDDEHHAEPVMRDADADQRDESRKSIRERSLAPTRRGAERHAGDKTHQRRAKGEHERIDEGGRQFAGDRTPRCNRYAEIAAEDAMQIQQILNRQRLVEAIGASQRLHHVRRRIGAGDRIDGVAGRDMQQREHQQRHADGDRRGVDDPSEHIVQHPRGLAAPLT